MFGEFRNQSIIIYIKKWNLWSYSLLKLLYVSKKSFCVFLLALIFLRLILRILIFIVDLYWLIIEFSLLEEL